MSTTTSEREAFEKYFAGCQWGTSGLARRVALDAWQAAIRATPPQPENAAPAVQVTPEMVREAEAHIPFAVNRQSGAPARWEWFANYYNQALAEPHKPCSCCGVTPSGEISASGWFWEKSR